MPDAPLAPADGVVAARGFAWRPSYRAELISRSGPSTIPAPMRGASVAREQRKLAAILAADVVGYSRLMGRDESGTLARLRKNRAERFDPVLTKYGGRVVKLTGDGALVEFASAVDGLSAAIEFQQAMGAANGDGHGTADTALVFRIGLHLGDLIVDGSDLYGDGVNVAARLEGQAPAGGILISRNVRDAVAGRVKATFEDLGGLSLKNIERPVRTFRVHWKAMDWGTQAAPEAPVAPAVTLRSSPPPLPLPDKPSIAVLPFQNLSGDPEQEPFTDGITEDIITELSRFGSLFVIARNSSFSYKGKSLEVRDVGRDLGVRYVLEGSMRKAANRIRVTGQLIDTLTGRHIWAERYDRVLKDVFAVQEEITLAIVAAIEPQIEAMERKLAQRRRPENLTAYETALRARAHALEALGKTDRSLIEQSIQEAEEALAVDPNCVQALQALAYIHGETLLLLMAKDRAEALRQAIAVATRAIELDPADALSYALRSLAVLRGRQIDRYADALADVRRAHQMNPNHIEALRVVAALEAGIGEPEAAIEHAQQVLRLSPRDPASHITHGLLAFACFGARRYSDGVEWALRALENQPGMLHIRVTYVACLVGLGNIDRAKSVFEEIRNQAPDYANAAVKSGSLYARPQDRLRMRLFVRIAADLEDPTAARALR